MEWINIKDKLPTEQIDTENIELFFVWMPENETPVGISVYEELKVFEVIPFINLMFLIKKDIITHWMYISKPKARIRDGNL